MIQAMPVRTAFIPLVVVGLFVPAAGAHGGATAPTPDPAKRLASVDAYMEKVVKDWNVPGIGVAVIVKDKVVHAKGYGYRDYGKKLPFTARTVVPIASNTKLFTATAAGLLVEDGKLEWDLPVRQFVPTIRFYNDALDSTVSIRDMLAHRTGITRHDSIWYKSDFTRKELFERLRYLEPTQPLRQTYLYNNMMYAGAGYVIELLSGQKWEDFVRARILQPLGMTSTVFSIEDLQKAPEHGVPYTERRDSFELYSIPYYSEAEGVGPAGSMNSNLEDLSRWVMAQLNEGRIEGRTVLPPAVIRATLSPSIALPNAALETRGWGEVLNVAYGAGRSVASYRGHLVSYHGGDINGFHSQVFMAPQDGIGIVVLVIGDHAAPLYNVVAYNTYERMMGMDLTPWSERQLAIRLKGKEAGKQARATAGAGKVEGTRPSHALADYAGEFHHPAYGVVTIAHKDGGLRFNFHKADLALSHFHYDRFDTADDEQEGKWSVNFGTSPQGEIDRTMLSLDQAEVTFVRQVPRELTSAATLGRYVGTYLTPTGARFQVVLRGDVLGVERPGLPLQVLVPWRPNRFRLKEFSDATVEFVVAADGKVTALKQVSPAGEFVSPRQ
jgi:CubicO group peptidase (beta-lactamase class C family)